MKKPISETEFRFLVEVRRAVGPPYTPVSQLAKMTDLESWVEFFADGVDDEGTGDFEQYVLANYDDIVEDGAFTPDHPEEHYGKDPTR